MINETMNFFFKKAIKFNLFILSATGLFLHLQSSWHQKLFGDEIHSLFFLANHNFWSLLTSPVEPIHPNGSYLLFKLIYSLTQSIFCIRLAMFALFLLSCWLIWQLLKQIIDQEIVRLIGLALWINSAYLWHFSFQLRMYGPAFVLVLASTLTLIKNKKLLSLLFDWLLLFFAYGGILFVIAKWLAYCCSLSFSADHEKKTENLRQLKQSLLYLLASLGPIILILINYFKQLQKINHSFLYWVKTPIWPDWSLGLASFFSGLFLPYFEGYALLNPAWIKLGKLLNLVGIVLLITGLGWLWKKTKSKQKFIINLLIFSLLAYTSTFVYSVLFKAHIYHIRQLFAVAVVSQLGLVLTLSKFWQYWPKLGLALGLILVIFNQINIVQDSFGENQAYVHHYQQLPGKPVVAKVDNIELIYRQCGTFMRQNVIDQCQQQDIYFSLSDLPAKTNRWWQTTASLNQTDIKNNTSKCKQVSARFYQCQK